MITNATVYPMHGPRGGHNPAGPARHPRVLTDCLVARLVRVNDVCRRLRQWNIRITRQSLAGPADSSLPIITIARDAHVSIVPMLDACGRGALTWIPGPPTVGVAVLDGVMIRWEELQ